MLHSEKVGQATTMLQELQPWPGQVLAKTELLQCQQCLRVTYKVRDDARGCAHGCPAIAEPLPRGQALHHTRGVVNPTVPAQHRDTALGWLHKRMSLAASCVAAKLTVR